MWYPSDVPIHRPSVGAMAVTTGSQMPPKITRPYVYRGTGEDQFPETDQERIDLSPPKVEAPTVEEYRQRQRESEKARAREVARMKRNAKKRKSAQWAVEARERREAQREAAMLDEIRRAVVRGHKRRKIKTVKTILDPPRQYRAHVRPAPEWRPLAGADLDRLLDEIG